MKITYIVNEIQQVGGIERVVCALSSWLADKEGYEVEIYSLCSSEKDKPFFPLSDKVELVNFNYHWKDCSGIRIIPIIRKLLKKCDSDIVITSHEYISLSAIWCRPFYKAKLIVCEHHAHDYKSDKGMLLDLWFLRFASKFVVLRDDDRDFYISKGTRNCITIPNFIEENNSFCADINSKSFVSVGRLTAVKGFDMLIEAFSMIHDKIPDWKLKIVGDGEERDSLKKQAEEKGVSGAVEFTGFVKDVYVQLGACSVFVMSSRSEGFPMCILEAMSAGLPCCSFALPAARCVVGDNGLLVEENDIEALAAAMLTLAKNTETRREYAEKSKSRAKDFSIDKIGARWMELFNEVTQK